ncbi:MAG TPA: nucleoside recognition domain-containing protein [Fimbriimonas sp.]
MSHADILRLAARHRERLGDTLHDRVVEALYSEAGSIADKAVSREGQRSKWAFDLALDRILTSKTLGIPAMILLFGLAFWITIAGANVPSAMLGDLLTVKVLGWLQAMAAAMGAPAWLSGFLIDGVYLSMAWVIAVMLPPMAIFFPLFTLLEDFGYLPRVAFNLDRAFSKAGAHGKQALSMMMGFGCNAAGVVATRIIDSPRERLIAILTNNFSICNGRWPTLILVGTIFIGATAPAALASLVAAGSVVLIALLGVIFTLLVSGALSKTVLKGETSAFTLELPPYRPPRVLQTIYTSLLDRTMIVLWRAIVMAAPAGAVIWLISNIDVSGQSIAYWVVSALNPFGLLVGLNGIILLAYIVAIPANEIIIPTILMLTLNLSKSALAQKGVMLELEENQVRDVLVGQGGWTLLTGINLMLFSLLHNPCSTTLLTIYRETGSKKWTFVAAALPIVLGLAVCFLTASFFRLMGWV